MSLDFNSLINKPQLNVAQPTVSGSTTVAQQPIAQQPVASAQTQLPEQPKNDSFQQSTPKENKKSKVLDNILKYSGVVALVAAPVAMVVSSRANQKAMEKLTTNITTEFGNKLSEVTETITKKLSPEEIAKTVTEPMKDTVKELSNHVDDSFGRVLKAIGAVGVTVSGFKFFKDKIQTPDGTILGVNGKEIRPLKEETIQLLSTESTKRIHGEYKWPEIDKINAWMITAETETFMKTGGLGEVGVQLPDAFNEKFGNDKDSKTTIVTPLYTDNKNCKLEKTGPDEYKYTGAQGKSIDIKKADSFKVKAFKASTNSFQDEEINVYTGTLNGTKYIFLGNDKFFDVTPAMGNNPACKGPYVLNKNNVDESERMAFLSKASYEFMKRAKSQEGLSEHAPNVIVSNDWHAGPLSALMRYSAPVEAEFGKIKPDLLESINNTPVIHIIHNLQYKGDNYNKADQIFRTLFGENTDTILRYAHGLNEEGSSLRSQDSNYNGQDPALNLADRVVLVSDNYAKEASKSEDLSCGYQNISKERTEYNTMFGIVNGYDKRKAVPNQGMVAKINKAFTPDTPLVPYEFKADEEGYNLKMKNKESMISVLNDLADKATKQDGVAIQTGRGPVKLYKPEECKIPADIDATKVPILASVGRFDNQKGFDYIATSVSNVLKDLKPGQERPIVAILGNGNAEITKQLQDFKDEVMKTDKEAGERILIFDGFSNELRMGLGIASDFFMIPSKWEPCGLTQMECMPDGSIPVANSTGGLVDTIKDGETGFLTDKFYGYYTNKKIYDSGKPSKAKDNVEAYTETLSKALNTFYDDPEKTKEIAIKAMAADYSWDVEGGALDQYCEAMKTGKVERQKVA